MTLPHDGGAAFARRLALVGVRLAAREERRVGRLVEAAGAELAGVRIAVFEGGARLTGRGMARRWRRGDLALAGWLEGVRARIGGRL